MATVVKSMAVQGIEGFEIEVEATTIRGRALVTGTMKEIKEKSILMLTPNMTPHII